MSRQGSRLVQAVIALILLTMSVRLWPSLGASATYAATCGNNTVCITNTPTVAVTLDGTDKTVNYTLAFTLNNNSNGGWNVTITSTLFTSGSHTLPSTASTVTSQPTATCQG